MLYLQATGDLDHLDAKRKHDFKEYEMEKKLETKEKLAKMSDLDRDKEVKRMDELRRKHNEHPKVNHPVRATVR